MDSKDQKEMAQEMLNEIVEMRGHGYTKDFYISEMQPFFDIALFYIETAENNCGAMPEINREDR